MTLRTQVSRINLACSNPAVCVFIDQAHKNHSRGCFGHNSVSLVHRKLMHKLLPTTQTPSQPTDQLIRNHPPVLVKDAKEQHVALLNRTCNAWGIAMVASWQNLGNHAVQVLERASTKRHYQQKETIAGVIINDPVVRIAMWLQGRWPACSQGSSVHAWHSS
jgi:hypothetical protein